MARVGEKGEARLSSVFVFADDGIAPASSRSRLRRDEALTPVPIPDMAASARDAGDQVCMPRVFVCKVPAGGEGGLMRERVRGDDVLVFSCAAVDVGGNVVRMSRGGWGCEARGRVIAGGVSMVGQLCVLDVDLLMALSPSSLAS
jgi:hypothetical protein